jgi:AraC-like DNA-binding protein
MYDYTMEDISILQQLSLQILRCESTVVDNHWDDYSLEHREGYSRIYYIKSGNGHISVEGRNLELLPGQIILLPAGATIQLHSSPGLDHHWINFQAFTSGGIPLFDLLEPRDYQREAGKEEVLYFTQILSKSGKEGGDSFDSLTGESLLLILLIPFLRGFQSHSTDHSSWLNQILTRIHEKLTEPFSIEDLAREAGCHPTYLSNAFSKKFAISPRQYIIKKRVELAQQLLWHGNKPIKEIALICGFGDVYYFYRCFKRITLQTPGEYRAKRDPYTVP